MESYVQTIFFAVSLLLAVGLCEAKYDYCQAPGIIPSENTDGLELQLLQILVRHGDRTPEWTMPIEVEWNCTLNWLNLPSNDFVDSMAAPKRLYRKTYLPNREILPGDCMYGQLTEKGLQQRVHIDGGVWHLDVGSSHPGAVAGPKGMAVRHLKWYVSWV
eukprot:TRINITY_DN3607_c0_g1_i2.p2 TRINITY_DN3607_c0_g1~~TRINITY_DN3607_c0_g1_i2.p2  ORF type:complete len:160 (-),score=3.59 TRINITY_DN3607_c0_g1_i2:20-499(-)